MIFILIVTYLIRGTTTLGYPSLASEKSNSETEYDYELEPNSKIEYKDDYQYQLREQLCPGTSLRFHRETGQCHFPGTKGPCEKNLNFQEEDGNTVYGQCDCNASGDERILIYHPFTKTCYSIFSKALCSRGGWLTLNKSNGQPKCEANPCYQYRRRIGFGKTVHENPVRENEELFLVNGRCIKLGSTCGESAGIFRFREGKISPKCVRSQSSNSDYSLAGIYQTKQKCKPGSFLSIAGKCRPSWVW